MRPILPILAYGLTLSTARADKLDDSAQQLSVADVFKVAVRTAPALAQAAFDRSRADAAVLTATGAEDFVFTASGGVEKTKGAPIPPSTVGDKTDIVSGSIGIAKLLPTNGTLELFGQSDKISSDFSGMPTTFVTSAVKLRLTQPLLKGFGPTAQSGAIKTASYNRDAATLRLRATALTFSADLAEAYWRLALAWRVLEVRRAGLELAQKQRKLTDAALRTGKIAVSEMLPVDAAIANREQDLLAAELDVVTSSLTVRKLAGLEITADKLAIKTEALPAIDTKDVDLATSVKAALDNSADVAAARAAEKAGGAAAAAARRDVLPRLDLRIEGGPLGTDADLGASFGRLGERAGYAFAANLNFEVPIGNRTAKGGDLDKRAAHAALRRSALEAEVAVTANVAQLVYEIRAHKKQVDAGLRAIKLAEQNVEAEQRKFELGKSGNNEIVRLQQELENARLRHAEAVGAYAISRVRLDAQLGTYLDKLGIKVEARTDLDAMAKRR